MAQKPYLTLRLRLIHQDKIAFGPGKADLLEAIQQSGSISQAARQLDMSYRRAWQLVDTMNHCFQQPLVETQSGGAQGGGTSLTPLGIQILHLFRQMEESVQQQANQYQDKFGQLLK